MPSALLWCNSRTIPSTRAVYSGGVVRRVSAHHRAPHLVSDQINVLPFEACIQRAHVGISPADPAERTQGLLRGKPYELPFCFRGYISITVEEDGQERVEAVPCTRCGGGRDA